MSDREDPSTPETVAAADRSPARPGRDGFVAAARSQSRSGVRTPTRRGTRGAGGSVAVGELIAQLQRIWQRQRFRADERAFARDIEKIVAQLGQRVTETENNEAASETANAGYSSDSSADGASLSSSIARSFSFAHAQQQPVDSSSDSGTDTSTPSSILPPSQRVVADANVERLLNAMDALFRHRYQEVRTLAFEIVNLCIANYGDQLTGSTRRRIFQQLEDHDQMGDSEQLQKTLRLLTADGRRVEPFQAELGWLLLQWLEESEEQRDLLNLIQQILRRSPLSLDFETVIAITSVVCGRCDVAWSRRDVDTCRRFLSFFHVLATHRLEHALGTSVCLRTLCWMVNADGQGTWSVMKHLLNSSAGFQVLRGLVTLLENPDQYNQWILRGAVFFVGMSCWGSQRVARLDEIKWAPILLALETCLECGSGVVVFEIILAIQRLIKKYGDCKSANQTDVGTSNSSTSKRLVVEWDIILRMFRTMRPWLSMNEPTTIHLSEGGSGGAASQSLNASSQMQNAVPIHMTRIPKELLDTLQVVTELVCDNKFGGEIDDFFEVLQDYFAYLPEPALWLLLKRKMEQAHPAYHADWLYTLQDTMETFFLDRQVPPRIRNETLELLQVNLWSSRSVCEDRVVEEVLLPMLSDTYDDPDVTIRRKALDLITEVARTLESVRFDALLDILERAIQLSVYEDSQICAIAGVVSLFPSYFNHLPQSRALRMYDIITGVVESHRNWEVRLCALNCLLLVSESSSDYRLQWRDNQIRTSRFLFCSRRAIRNQQTGSLVPVQRGLRALLTLISTESRSLLFRMAVEGLRRMLHNRVVLSDIDISDAAMKVISCVDYQAFGRAAIADELSTQLADLDGGVSSDTERYNNQGSRLRSESTSGDYSVRTSRNHVPIRIDVSAVRTDLREAAALLCKIRFTTMGLQLLELFLSYVSELNPSVRHHLIVCIVGTLDTQLHISENDLTASHEDEHDSSSTHSGSAWIWPSRPRSKRSTTANLGHSSVDDAGVQQAAQSSGHGTTSNSESKPASPHLAFTSRVLSKLQSSAQHSTLFNALSSGSHVTENIDRKAAAEAAASSARRDRERLQRCLRLIFEAEFFLLHTATNAVSLLGHIAPDVVAARLDMLLRSSKKCFITPDGSFRNDGYFAVLEMIGNVVLNGSVLDFGLEHRARILEDFVLVAFSRHLDKATTYLAYRILCEIMFQCKDKDHRVALSAIAIPSLRDSATMAITNHSLTLAEVAIDFLTCFGLSRSDIVAAPALRVSTDVNLDGAEESRDPVSRRSWIHHNTILTIEVRPSKPALLVVRRPSSTSRWHLAMRQDYSQLVDVVDTFVHSQNEGAAPSMMDKATAPTGAAPIEERVAPIEHSSSLPPFRPPNTSQLDKRSDTPAMKWKTSSTHPAFAGLPPHHLPVPPLPAYDGIGGSPSFFCEPSSPVIEGSVMDSLLLSDEGHEPVQSPRDELTVLSGTDDDNDLACLAASVPDEIEASSSIGGPDCSDCAEKLAAPPTTGEESGEVAALFREGDDSSNVVQETRSLPKISNDSAFDPLYLMVQLFDLGVDDRPQLLTDGAPLTRGLNVLDRTPEFETHKIGVLYQRHSKRKTEVEILNGFGGSVRYLRFLRVLGTVTPLEGLRGFAGGMDTSDGHGDGKCTILYRSHSFQMVFHVATMMNSREELSKEIESSEATNDRKSTISTMMKKRHIGNDFVHIVFKECDDEYDVGTFSGQFNDVHIIVQPLNDHEFRTQVTCKPGIPPFGPLYGTQVIPSAVVAQCVRQTALNANLACHAFHQELIGFTMNCEERLKQIKQLGARLTTHSDEWTLEV